MEMCGRFTSLLSAEILENTFGVQAPPAFPPRYNIAPTQQVWTIRETAAAGRHLSAARWGLVPHWAKDLSIGSRMINARCETIHEKAAFRQAIRARRCIVPASGFFEWVRHESRMCDCPAEPSDRTCRPIGSTLRGMATRQQVV